MTSIFKTLSNKLFAVTDGTYDRASMGNLDAHTGPNGVTSPAQYGFRAINAAGNAIFDSMGLIDVFSSAGSAAGSTSQAFVGAGAGSFSLMTGTDFAFNIIRPARIQYKVFVTGRITAGAGTGYIRGNIVGFDVTAQIMQGTTGTATSSMEYFTGPGATFSTLPAGSYTAQMEVAADVGTTWTAVQYFHQIIVAGA